MQRRRRSGLDAGQPADGRARSTSNAYLRVQGTEPDSNTFASMASRIPSIPGILLVVWLLFLSAAHPVEPTKIYLIPGQGSDARIFSQLTFPAGYEVVHVAYERPDKGERMAEYARRLSQQIPEDSGFILIGVSLGGMLAAEMAEFKHPKQVILIASARNATELPKRYTFQRRIPLYKLVGPKLSKWGAKRLQPIVEPDRNQEKETFKAMLDDKDPVFLKRTIGMIITWERDTNTQPIVHIHGDKDHTLPIKHVQYDYLIPDGSHMMTLTRAEELSLLLGGILVD